MTGRLLVPYAGDWPDATISAVLDEYQWFDLKPDVQQLPEGDITAYWNLLCRVWLECGASQQDLTIIEHDIVIHDSVFEQFEGCAQPVCTFTYWMGGSYSYGLGCVRFRAELIAEHKDLMLNAGNRADDGLPIIGHWKRMDTRTYAELTTHNVSPCLHTPHVKHLHDYPMEEPA